MNRKIKTALITGSEGFIGNYLTRLLLLKNYNAVIEALEKEKANITIKGDLIKQAFITSTMGVSYKLKLSKNI